jgi:hypothetical protein
VTQLLAVARVASGIFLRDFRELAPIVQNSDYCTDQPSRRSAGKAPDDDHPMQNDGNSLQRCAQMLSFPDSRILIPESSTFA